MRILVTGGAGYKGTMLCQRLLDAGHQVTALDWCMYGQESILGLARSPRFHLVKKDVRNLTEQDVDGYDMVYHLAALSGFPACDANPFSAYSINVDATERLVTFLAPEQTLVYASTTSIYGASATLCDESMDVPPPVSTYAASKRHAELICQAHPRHVIFRVATLFGVAPRMRWELMANNFVMKAVQERALVLYGAHKRQALVHIDDAVTAYVQAASDSRMLNQIWNVGHADLNLTKLDLAERIREQVPFEIINTELPDPDKRNFSISFEKIATLGWSPRHTLEDGIAELVRLFRWYSPIEIFRLV